MSQRTRSIVLSAFPNEFHRSDARFNHPDSYGVRWRTAAVGDVALYSRFLGPRNSDSQMLVAPETYVRVFPSTELASAEMARAFL